MSTTIDPARLQADNPVSRVAAARAIAPVLARDRAAAEDAAAMTDEVRAAAGTAGMFRLFAPADVGGLELPLTEMYEVLEELAAADPSVAWHAANSTAAGRVAACLGVAQGTAILDDSDFPYGWSSATGGRAVPVEGGFRLAGRWGFVTGVDHARWCALTAIVPAQGDGASPPAAPDARVFVVRRADLEVHPTFRDASAMRGTGSNAASADDLFVPDGFVFRWTDPLRVERPAYRLPYFLFAAACFAGTAVGILRGALAGSVELMSQKSSSITGASHYDQPRVKETIANADAAARALRAGMLESTAEVSEAAETGSEIPPPIRARLYASALFTMDTARLTVSDLYARSSSVAYATRNPVERSLREVHALAAALDSGPFRPVQMAAGRVLLGHDPGPVPQF